MCRELLENKNWMWRFGTRTETHGAIERLATGWTTGVHSSVPQPSWPAAPSTTPPFVKATEDDMLENMWCLREADRRLSNNVGFHKACRCNYAWHTWLWRWQHCEHLNSSNLYIKFQFIPHRKRNLSPPQRLKSKIFGGDCDNHTKHAKSEFVGFNSRCGTQWVSKPFANVSFKWTRVIGNGMW